MPRMLLTLSVVLALVATSRPALADPEPLAGTQPLTMEGDITDQLVAGVDRFLLQEIEASVAARARHWHRDTTSPEKYDTSVAANRQHLARIIGAVDERLPPGPPQSIAAVGGSPVLAEAETYLVKAVEWRVLRGVDGEGLVLEPKARPAIADVIVLPDADQRPELLAGLVDGPAGAAWAATLAASGCRVFIPTLLDRDDTYSIVAGDKRHTNLPHREFIYRQAFEMGRHVIGYEVQKVMALVDWLDKQRGQADRSQSRRKIGVCGYGEGGLIALYAGALDTRIDTVGVSGYFGSRQRIFEEPIYRNVFGLLDEFGDAELASLVGPRDLLIEECRVPRVDGPPAPGKGLGSPAAPGKLTTPSHAEVQAEFDRASKLTGLENYRHWVLQHEDQGQQSPGSWNFLDIYLQQFGNAAGKVASAGSPAKRLGELPDADARMKRQVEQLVDFTQNLLADSEATRDRFWAKANRSARSVEQWEESVKPYREYFYHEVIGRFDKPLSAPNVRTRKAYDQPSWTGYEVVMDVFPGVIGYGVLCVPKNLPAGQKRPVVVCQHGLEGRPQDTIEAGTGERYYHRFAADLADRGFITYAPQNLYIFKDRFRNIQLKSNALKKTLYSTIVPQHQQAVNWLGSLPMVDPERIAFYGLSYGGKTAMRVPALVDGYCLSICSGDFNEWIAKNASARMPMSYLGKGEYEIFEFDLGNTFNYAEMAALIAPRPFMVERGHRDGVGTDPYVSYEYAKVRLLYTDLRIADRTTIEYFDGPHTIHGIGTYDFLYKHLRYP